MTEFTKFRIGDLVALFNHKIKFKLGVMEIKREITIKSGVDNAWDVLGNQFGEMDKWATFVQKSEVSGYSELPGLSYSIRSLETANGPTKQRIISFNPENHSLSYEGIQGVPFFLNNPIAIWALTQVDDSNVKLELSFSAETKGIVGAILGPIVKMKFGKIGDELLDDFKQYVETGKPSSRKMAV